MGSANTGLCVFRALGGRGGGGGESAGAGGTPASFLAGVGGWKVGWGDEDRWRESREKEGGQRREDRLLRVITKL